MARHADFYPLILPAVLGCPYPTVDFAINRAAIELCQAGRVWEEAIDPVVLVAGVSTYDVSLPTDSVLVCIRSAQMGGDSLPAAQSWIELEAIDAPAAVPEKYAMRGQELIVHPKPATTGARIALVATLKPSFTARTLPDVLLDMHMAAVAEGAKAFLKEMSGTAWFDPSGAVFSHQRFRDEVSRARIAIEHGFVSGSLSVTPKPFGQR